MRIVRLHGNLGKRFGFEHELDVRDPAEAIRALSANFRGFREHLIQDSVIGYQCLVDGGVINEDQLRHPMSQTFSIVPVISGGGKTGRIIAGIALIAIAIFRPELIPVLTTGSAEAGTLITWFSASTVGWVGVALTLSGVAQMLAPTPKNPDSEDNNENQYFNGPVNTTAQGSAIPVGYGRMIVGSAVISAAITIDSTPDPIYPIDFFIGGFR